MKTIGLMKRLMMSDFTYIFATFYKNSSPFSYFIYEGPRKLHGVSITCDQKCLAANVALMLRPYLKSLQK
jgi:hypothetical protein